MADVIDIFTKIKLKDYTSYEDRFDKCIANALANGACFCKICKKKVEIANKIVYFASKELVDFMKQEQIAIYQFETLQVLLLASKVAKKKIYKDE